jgi:HlyD family secretion protein
MGHLLGRRGCAVGLAGVNTRALVVAVVVLAAGAAAVVLATRRAPPQVTVHVVARGPVESTVANTRAGTVNARRRARLAPSTGGQVARLLVEEGDRVEAGQLLLELWHEDLDAQLELARSEQERAVALADEARLRAELAERDAKRQQELQGITSGSEVDRYAVAAQAARAAERAAFAEAGSRARQIEVLRANTRRLQLHAPFAGVVAEVNGEVGEFATPSPVGIPTPPAIDLVDLGGPYVTAPIDEVDAGQVRVGMTARITLDAFGKRAFVGTVRRVAPYVLDREKQARTVDVEVAFAAMQDGEALLPGYSADVEIVLAARDDVLRVPTDALRDGTVLVVGADGTVERRAVATGLANWRFTEVVDGLAAGERVVAAAGDAAGVVPGARVTVARAAGGNGGKP